MRIGELAQAAGTTAKTLRFYEDQGLLLPAARTGSGYRDYGPETLARLDFIHRGQAAGLTLAQIRQILQIRDTGTAPCEHVRELLGMRLELERRAEEYFRGYAEESTGAVAELYRELAAEEVEHIDMLISELTALREARAGLL